MKEGNASAMLTSQDLQEFTFGIWAAKICLPYGKRMWPARWLVGNDHKYDLS
jgi:beta-glucanase (GH16 family)